MVKDVEVIGFNTGIDTGGFNHYTYEGIVLSQQLSEGLLPEKLRFNIQTKGSNAILMKLFQ